MDADRERVGTRHDGSGRVEFDGPDGRVEFDAYVGLDVDLGWDYILGPHGCPAG